jgi:hypothetical protein
MHQQAHTVLYVLIMTLVAIPAIAQFVCDVPYLDVDTISTRFEFFNCTSSGIYTGFDENGHLTNETFFSIQGLFEERDPEGNVIQTINDVLYSVLSSIPPEDFPLPPVNPPPGTIITPIQFHREDVPTKTGRLVRLEYNLYDFVITYFDVCADIVDCVAEIAGYPFIIPAGVGKISVVVDGWPFAHPDNFIFSERILQGSNKLVDCVLTPLDRNGDEFMLQIVGTESVYTSIVQGYVLRLDGNFTRQYYRMTIDKIPINPDNLTLSGDYYDAGTSFNEPFLELEFDDDDCNRSERPPRVPAYEYCIFRNIAPSYDVPIMFDPSIAVLVSGTGNSGGGRCGSSSQELNKPILIASAIAAGICIIFILLVTLASEFPPCGKIIKGRETFRISRVRRVQKKYRRESLPSIQLDSSRSGDSSRSVDQMIEI